MNNIKNILKIALLLIAFTSFTACDEGGDPDQEATTTGRFAGDWWVDISDSDGNVLIPHALMTTVNTAANDNTMWINDEEHEGLMKCKMTIDPATGTFSATDSENLLTKDPSTVNITEGLVSFGTGVSKGGHVVNSIQFKVEFSEEPGVIYTFKGTQWTGFLEDEY
ncbi:MAG TPA: lipid-binding protein [Flavobacterium sp.]|nr:lipid-binding protein [Flavobacterium sp.]